MSPVDYNRTFSLDELDVEFLKNNYLLGFEIKGPDGQPYPDSFYATRLQIALGQLEEITSVDVVKRVNESERHDYRATEYLSYGFVQLFRFPTIRVSEIRAVFPAGNTVLIFPSNWLRVETTHSFLQIVPTGGTLTQVAIGMGGYYPFVWSSEVMPQLWEVDYVSGFEPDAIPWMIVDAICKLAAIEIWRLVSNFVRPIGVASQSLSVDGLSQSRGFMQPAFKAVIDAYSDDLYGPFRRGDGLIDQIRLRYVGPLVTSG